MRLLYLSHSYPRREGDVAGAFIALLAAAVVHRGHTVTVLAPSDRGANGSETVNGVLVRRVRYAPAAVETLAYAGTMADALRSVGGVAAVAAFITAHVMAARLARAQLVHAHWWVPGGVTARLVRLTGGPPYVVTLHGTDIALLDKSPRVRSAARSVLRGARAVTAASSYLATKAAKVAGLDPANIVIHPMPSAITTSAQTSRGGAGIVTVGRLTTQKHIGDLIDAVRMLKDRGRPLRLTVVGDGPERANLERRAAERGVGDLTTFLGAVPPSEVPAALGDADVFAFPATDEGLGLAAAEALMCGIPVVACRSGGVPDIVPDGGAGRLVPPGDVNAFAAAIEHVLADRNAPALARDAGTRLRERLTPEATAQVFEQVYQSAIRTPARIAHA